MVPGSPGKTTEWRRTKRHDLDIPDLPQADPAGAIPADQRHDKGRRGPSPNDPT